MQVQSMMHNVCRCTQWCIRYADALNDAYCMRVHSMQQNVSRCTQWCIMHADALSEALWLYAGALNEAQCMQVHSMQHNVCRCTQCSTMYAGALNACTDKMNCIWIRGSCAYYWNRCIIIRIYKYINFPAKYEENILKCA